MKHFTKRLLTIASAPIVYLGLVKISYVLAPYIDPKPAPTVVLWTFLPLAVVVSTAVVVAALYLAGGACISLFGWLAEGDKLDQIEKRKKLKSRPKTAEAGTLAISHGSSEGAVSLSKDERVKVSRT
jgi:hypothetical protein